MSTYFNKDQSLSSSYVESSPNMMYSHHHHNNNNYSSSSSSPFQEISTNGEKQSRLPENDFNSWRDNQLLLLHGGGGGGGTQELSLSLSPHMQMPPFLGCSNLSISAHDNLRLQEDDHLNNLMQIDHNGGHGHGHGHGHISRSFPNSKYLRVAQELLDEVVNVRKALKRRDSNMELQPKKDNNNNTSSPQDCSGSKVRTELSSVEKHNLQEKLTKLIAMLDEVDRRYKQYYNHMQIVVSSFETVAGNGAARPYTALAVQTISRHFRSLREAITGQMKLTRKSLGEEEDINGNIKGIGISRLRHVDQQLRQQKQLGIMQQHAWRPQRGLPENSVSILRAWLFEHFLHPYPKDSDKIVLARETGLTRNQVSNWFINARVRLWKPMVEEMYKEEFGIPEMGSKSSSDLGSSPPAAAGAVEEMEMVPGNLTISEMDHDGSVFQDAIWFGNNGGGGGGGVSLTLGLHNLGENYRLPISTGDLNQFNNTVRSDGHGAHVYNINVGSDAAAASSSSHLLLHDFVA
ncbi:BEL1-like homeodomain protein 7 [Impatiens glandulifera]|uniref:BEL1-like homeodomain protein 7 n=1 Tax=Impatiens glandulifera TaxID=253017 RepID=UPI001FB15533|nr:BEL1-like homeodomain protein 7 [Impatiens glandulifera]